MQFLGYLAGKKSADDQFRVNRCYELPSPLCLPLLLLLSASIRKYKDVFSGAGSEQMLTQH